jgi:hypothetical protein
MAKPQLTTAKKEFANIYKRKSIIIPTWMLHLNRGTLQFSNPHETLLH